MKPNVALALLAFGLGGLLETTFRWPQYVLQYNRRRATLLAFRARLPD
jgi:hypothetical protein